MSKAVWEKKKYKNPTGLIEVLSLILAVLLE